MTGMTRSEGGGMQIEFFLAKVHFLAGFSKIFAQGRGGVWLALFRNATF